MRFGHFFLPVSLDPSDDFRLIDDCLYEAEMVEELGWDAIWLSEHHFGGETAYADPLVFGGAIAAKTKRVQIGFSVVELELHNPVRLAIQTALVDNISRGRLIVGLGRGSRYNVFEYKGFGTTMEAGRDHLEEAEDLLIKAWTSDNVDYTGKYWQVSFPFIRPRPYQQPHPPLARACATDQSVVEMARMGRPILLYCPTIEGVGHSLDLYHNAMCEAGLDEQTVERCLDNSWVWRDTYVAETDAQAMDEYLPAFERAVAHMNELRQEWNPTPRITWDLTAPSGSTALHSKKHYDAVGEEEANFQSVGTGPWELVEATSDVSRTVRAVPGHWRKTPEWETMVWHDILYNPESIQAIKDENLTGVEFMTFPGENSFYLNLFGQQYNTDHPAHQPGPDGADPRVPLGENAYDCTHPWVSCDRDVNSAEWANARKVREATTIAIDRQKLVNNLAFGEGAPIYINHWIGHEPRMAENGLDELTWEFNPERAKELLTEAGFPDGFEINMTLPGIPWAPGGDEAGQAVAPMWESVGIKVTQQVTPYSAFRPGALVAREFAGVSTHGNSVPIEPISSDSLFYSSTSVINFGIEHPELQALLEDALNTVNAEERWPKQAAVAKWAYDNIAYFSLYQSNLVWPIGPELGRWEPQGLQRSWLSNWEYAPHR